MSYLDDMFGLSDKTIIITGGGGVIAGALSEGLLNAGAKVMLWDISKEGLDAAIQRLGDATGKGGNVSGLIVDTTDEDSIDKAVRETEAKFTAPNGLINAAGGNRGKCPFLEIDKEQFEFVLKLNLIAGLVAPTKVVAKYWIEKNIKGSIINMTSMSSYIPLSGVWAYDAAKSATLNLTMASAAEFASSGIRVNAIAPGFFIGKQNKALLMKEDGELTDRGKDVIRHTPFGRFGDVSELIGAAIYLMNEKASGFVTGVSLPVDGGYLVHNI